MAQAPKKSLTRSITTWFRKLIARPAAEFGRTGRIARTLYDATHLQRKRDRYLQQMGDVAAKLFKDGKIKDIRIERLMAKIETVDHSLDRQEALMKSYQSRGDVQGTLGSQEEEVQDNLEPN